MTETRKGPGASLLRCSSVLTGCGERRQIRSLACSQGGEPICGQGCLQRAGHSEQGKLQRAHLQNVARLGLRLYNFVILKLFIIFPAKDLASGHCTAGVHRLSSCPICAFRASGCVKVLDRSKARGQLGRGGVSCGSRGHRASEQGCQSVRNYVNPSPIVIVPPGRGDGLWCPDRSCLASLPPQGAGCLYKAPF
ncbi:unnamed protein product [Rangifer tarandus platyrhynchus]|uniref:Uncharacterized protein n=1 Tax=Rangifer tarandus platyrhynchus TaxID=3082113 RepID=A0ABN9A063_RANTA|nr:unnamed protein product [Rangifer tarandus platyrhynchus]